MDGHYHDWPAVKGPVLRGVIIGLAKCRICGTTSTADNINEWSPAKTIDNQQKRGGMAETEKQVVGQFENYE